MKLYVLEKALRRKGSAPLSGPTPRWPVQAYLRRKPCQDEALRRNLLRGIYVYRCRPRSLKVIE